MMLKIDKELIKKTFRSKSFSELTKRRDELIVLLYLLQAEIRRRVDKQ